MLALLLQAALAAPPAPPTVDRPFEARPRRHWDVTDLALDVIVDPHARTVEGTARHTLAPLGLPSDTVRLHQVALDVLEVRVDGVPVADVRLGPETLDVPVRPGEPHVVEVRWRATPETGVHFRGRGSSRGVVEAWTQGEAEDHRFWFPGWDHPSDTFPVTIALSAPDGLHAVANGALVAREPAARAGYTRWTYRLDQPIVSYLVAFAVGEYAVHRDDGPVPHEYVVPRTVPEAVARQGLDASPAMMAWLAELLGEPYPYPVYRQVVVQRFLYGGMENASTTVLADRLLARPGEAARHDTARVVAHELAHQWFGDLLTTHGWRELWLNEGFATFYAARWAEHLHGEEEYAAQVLGWAPPAAGTTRPMANRGWAAPGAGDHTAQYVRGATVLHALRAWLGDPVFDEAIRRYVARHRFSLVETADLRRAFEEVTGNDLRWFFDPLVHGWGAPRIEARWTEAGERLKLTLVQTGEVPAWQGPLRVDWADEDGVHTEQLWLSPGTTHLEAPARGVRWVAVDPAVGVLAHWTRHQPTSAWVRQLAEAPTAAARLVAAQALGAATTEGDAAARALAEALAGGHALPRPAHAPYDTHRLAVRAAEALGALASPAARDALLPVLTDARAPEAVREAVAGALAAFPLDPAVVPALERAARDPLPSVAAAALGALATAQPSRAPAAAARALSARDPSLGGDLHAAALRVLAAGRDPALIDRALRHVGDPQPAVQLAAGDAAARLARLPEAGDRRRAQVARALAGWLDHEDQRVRGAGVHHLAALGAVEALPALQAFAARTTLPAHQEAARAAITRIRAAARGAPEDPDALLKAQATLKALEERLKDVESRLRRVETW